MYHRILVPLDGSERAEAILSHVEDLAQHYDATLLLLQVVRLLLPGGEFARDAIIAAQVFEEQLARARAYLQQIQARLAKQGVRAEVQVVQGGTVAEILKVAEEGNVDLIAMASHGRSGLARVFYGSVTAGVIHRVDRPLLLVRSREEP